MCRVCDGRPPDPSLDGICRNCLMCSQCNTRPPDPDNNATEYEGYCFKCVPAPVVEEPIIDYKIKEVWTQYINDNNMLFRTSLKEKIRKKLQLGRSCFDVVKESRARFR